MFGKEILGNLILSIQNGLDLTVDHLCRLLAVVFCSGQTHFKELFLPVFLKIDVAQLRAHAVFLDHASSNVSGPGEVIVCAR